MGDYPRRDREPERLRFTIELTEENTWLCANRPSLRIDADLLHGTEVDHDATIAHRVSRETMPTPTDCGEEFMFASESYGCLDVSD
jgi:hypothetical protein